MHSSGKCWCLWTKCINYGTSIKKLKLNEVVSCQAELKSTKFNENVNP